MSGSTLFRELRRRHVWRVAVAYGITGWLLVQLASIVLPTFGAPDWVMKAVLGLVVLFFPVALIVAWAFEITPEGVRRTVPEGHQAERAPEAAHQVGRTLNRATMAALVVAVAVLGWREFGRSRAVGPARAADGRAGAAAAGVPDPAAAVPARSVAVLPFESLSADSSNAYFASGMQDMILTKLAALGDLKVISRTSTQEYGSRPENLRTIGRELGVASVLEGSVQKSGRQVLVNVQLIDASTDNHLWAESYTRTLEDVFGVEGEVAQKVADALHATLTPAERERVTAAPTADPEAYDLYLQADAHAHRAYDSNNLYAQELPRAIPLYEQALVHDSTFALADAALATAHMNLYWFAPDRTEARLAAAKAAADRALRLEPDLGEAHVGLALWHYWGHRDYDGAQEELERARASMPNSAEVEQFLAAIERRRGEWERSIASHRKAILLDPRRSDILDQLALSYQSLRRYAEADTIYARAMAMARDSTDDAMARAWNAFIWKGDLQVVRAALARLQPGSDRYRAAVSGLHYQKWLDRDFDAAIRTARSDTAADWADPNNIALPRELQLGWDYEAAGRMDAARKRYEAVRARMRSELARHPDVPDLHLGLAFAEAGVGMKDEAVRDARRAAEMMPPGRDAVTGPGYLCYLAQVYVRVGRKEPAVALLRRLMDLPAGGIVSPAILRTDPVWDPIRDEPGFRALLADRGPVPISGASASEAP